MSTRKIVSHYDAERVLWEGEAETMAEAIAKARARGADLRGAYLRGADLGGAYLGGADLGGADLRGRGAILTDDDLKVVREDFIAVLDAAPGEVAGLALALEEGRVDGSCYEGQCACLVGTIAKVRGVRYTNLGALTPNASRPAELWFLSIRPGHTPERSGKVKELRAWIAEWQAARAAVAEAVAS